MIKRGTTVTGKFQFEYVHKSVAFPDNLPQHGNNVMQFSTTWLQRNKNMIESEHNACSVLRFCYIVLHYDTLPYAMVPGCRDV